SEFQERSSRCMAANISFCERALVSFISAQTVGCFEFLLFAVVTVISGDLDRHAKHVGGGIGSAGERDGYVEETGLKLVDGVAKAGADLAFVGDLQIGKLHLPDVTAELRQEIHLPDA